MFNFLNRKKYHHLNKILVDQQALIDNHQTLKQLHPHVQIAPVLKSNAYGHGLTTVAPVFDQLQPPFLIVDSLYEAYELYKKNIKTPILIIGYTDPRNYAIKPLPFHYSIFDLETAQALNKHQPGCSIHIFVDTGMSREGVQLKDLLHFVTELQKLKNLKIEGLASHFADADNPTDFLFTKEQIMNYHQALQIINDRGIDPQWKHISASAGAFSVKDSVFNLIRAGIASYGISPFEKQLNQLQPALTFESTLTQIKQIQQGDLVSYGLTYKAPQDMTIGILPAGYHEGIDRRLSNRGVVKIQNQLCPIIGRVCMNLTIIDLTKVDKPQVGDKVEIYSADKNARSSIFLQAEAAQTIPNKLLTGLDSSLNRKLV
ncbi:MAG: alanine racemase [Candidatus Pacebacteria bacterium]|jgi:alanine racemase|nr:alanine racemase [Candidatus Paceibacterota bacterium]MBT3511699.1 alanine racemase [Candidatus Paceibacterota bacterium]MBT4005128.1 alanine racemase [Candidatus Paceibacterota bacterium]MBT4358585.1 alanine racemase [Candidatus Paceibacterota bacterium]MBT4680725.1 alanine racemase [Candidatus Paceibacterota bacterium]